MSYLNDTEKERLVVPVRCDTKQGTAFFINETQLLTARHVVSAHVNSPRASAPIYIEVAGKKVKCKGVALSVGEDKIDLALLTLDAKNYRCEQPKPLKLLSDKYVQGQSLYVYGYPREVAMGCNLIDMEVENELEIVNGAHGDRALIRKSGLNIRNYDGLSGSPVVSVSGRVVGVIVIQFNETLNYLSISKAQEYLKNEGIIPNTDWQRDDMTIAGEGRSYQFCQEAIVTMGDRYMPYLHQENEDLEKILDFYSDKDGAQKSIKKVLTFADCVHSLPDIHKKQFQGKLPINEPTRIILAENADIYYECFKYFRSDKFRSRKGDKSIDELNKSTEELTKADFKCVRYASSKALLLVGKAGSGKTHSLCRFADTRQSIANIYLFFGTSFAGNKHPKELIKEDVCKGMEFSDFNAKMKDKNRYAVIVIDALNEGLGCKYWNFQLESLRAELAKHDHFRLIVSVRTPFDKEVTTLSNEHLWNKCHVEGFIDSENAIKDFFKFNDIPEDYPVDHVDAFKNPLFLKIFCETFHSLDKQEKGDLNKRTLYKRYVEKKNAEVSDMVDEDPELNIAEQYLSTLANYSAFSGFFNTISRRLARKYARRLVRYRTWKQDLLNACLTTNLLLADRSKTDESSVMFEYENMGDYYKAEELLHSKMGVEQLLDWLDEKKRYIDRHPDLSSDKFQNAVKALFDCWYKSGMILYNERQVQSGGALYEIYCDFLKESDLPNDERVDILNAISNRPLNPFSILRKATEDTLAEAKDLHRTLIAYPTIGSRDLNWTRYVNQLYELNGDKCVDALLLEQDIATAPEEQIQETLLYFTWMLTSSHPKFRAILIRKIRAILLQRDDQIIWLIKIFEDVNDPYVLNGLYCAICGVLLPSRDVIKVKNVAEHIYKHYYEHENAVPQDLIVRQWTLKIIERACYLDNDYDYWKRIVTPFKPQPVDKIDIPTINQIDKVYFGKEQGSIAIYNSMFSFEDFNRYIIGTNNRNVSDDYFVKKEDGKYYGVPLDDIKTRMSYYILRVFDWNDELGRLDNGRYSRNRSHNDQERIGKKFQWLAWYKVNAYMMDAYRTTQAQYHYRETATENELAEHPYPWNSAEVSRFDPTLTTTLKSEYPSLLTGIDAQPIVGEDDENWIDNNQYLPTFRHIAKALDGAEYVMLMCYDSTRGNVKETFLYSNACFVKKEDAKRFANWAKNQNFYGRWMPERQGNTEFLWGDYPWADAYKSSLEQDDVYQKGNCPCDFHLSYEAQLQEDWEGIDYEDEYLSTVYMPSVEIMEKMELYCSETRGVVKAQDGSIAAINAGKEDGIQGLFIRRDILDEFLDRTDYAMFYYVLGEKVYRYEEMRSIMQDLSAAYQYYPQGAVIEIQPMRVIEKSLPKRRTMAEKMKRIAELEKKQHEEGWTQREMIEYIDLKKELNDERKPEE